MTGFVLYILTALALIFIIEGLLYALFPEKVQKMMAQAIALSPKMLSGIGMVMAAVGLLFLALLQMISGH